MKARYPYGTVLKIQREDTPESIARHLERVRDLGLTFVVIWPAVYWWEDRSASRYPFATGHFILDRAGELELSVIMELAGQIASLEYAPDFLMKDEYFVQDRHGHPIELDWSYYAINYNHPEVRALTRESFAQVAREYRGHDSLYGYDVWNETMFTSYDQFTLARFREWLRFKYGSLDALNASWERAYREWDQVRFTNWHWASVMPYVDLEEFRRDNIGIILADWRDAIRAEDPNRPVLADNVGSMVVNGQWGYLRPQDDWNIASNVDEAGYSIYPKSRSTHPPWRRWQTMSALSSAAPDRRFWVAELQTHFATMHIPESRVEPWELLHWTWEAIAHGARGIVYWKWRPFPKGYQTHGRGIVDVRGEYTERADAVREVGRVLDGNAGLFRDATPVHPRVGILYDRRAHAFSKAYVERVPLEIVETYTDSLAGLHRALWDAKVPACYVSPAGLQAGEADECTVLFVSNQVTVDAELADSLRRFAEGGGTVVVDGKFGTVNDTGLLHDDLPGPESLRAALGYRIADLDGTAAGIELSAGTGPPLFLRSAQERQRIELVGEGATTIATFDDGLPAAIHVRVGHGEFFVFATCLWLAEHREPSTGARRFLSDLADRLTLRPIHVDEACLHPALLASGNDLVAAVFNYTDAEQSGTVTLPCPSKGNHGGVRRVRELRREQAVTHQVSESCVAFRATVPPTSVAVYHVQCARPDTATQEVQ